MTAEHLTLDRRIRKDLKASEQLWHKMELAGSPDPQAEEEDLIVTGYRLHGLYSAFENIFQNITKTFGNSLDHSAGWHADLLDRMRLDLTPLRPAVIDDEMFADLDELRRFRHLFRVGYGLDLDAERIALVWHRAMALRAPFRERVEGFLEFLATFDV